MFKTPIIGAIVAVVATMFAVEFPWIFAKLLKANMLAIKFVGLVLPVHVTDVLVNEGGEIGLYCLEVFLVVSWILGLLGLITSPLKWLSKPFKGLFGGGKKK